MKSIPYGYSIENGLVMICDDEAERIRKAFQLYSEGISLTKISKETGIGKAHTGMMNILKDEKYKGTDTYPEIVSEELFNKVREESRRRKEKHRRYTKTQPKLVPYTKFVMKESVLRYEDPFRQAQYMYSLIEGKSAL